MKNGQGQKFCTDVCSCRMMSRLWGGGGKAKREIAGIEYESVADRKTA